MNSFILEVRYGFSSSYWTTVCTYCYTKEGSEQFLTGFDHSTLPTTVILAQASQSPFYPSHLVGSKRFPRTKNNVAKSLPETLSNLKSQFKAKGLYISLRYYCYYVLITDVYFYFLCIIRKWVHFLKCLHISGLLRVIFLQLLK